MSKIISTKCPQKRGGQQGFAFVMLSIMAMFIGIIVYGTVLTTSSSRRLNRVKITKEKMQKIEEALHSFVLTNKYLPCPAFLNAKQEDNNYGKDISITIEIVGEDEIITNDVCSNSSLVNTTPNPDGQGVFEYDPVTESKLYYGAVPTRTLGLEDNMGIDEWGSKIVYVIDDSYTIATTSANDSGFTFHLSEGSGASENGGISLDSIDYVYLILSNGVDKDGAYPANGTDISPNSTSDEDEDENQLVSGIFDEIFAYKSKDILLLGSENKLRDLVVIADIDDTQTNCICSSYSQTLGTETINFNAVKCGETSYSNEVCPSEVDNSPDNSDDYYYISNDENERPYLECEDGEDWEDDDIQNPCTLLPTCSSLKSSHDSHSISWTKVEPSVYTRDIEGVYNDGSGTKTIHGVCMIDEKNSITDATMEWGYYVEQ